MTGTELERAGDIIDEILSRPEFNGEKGQVDLSFLQPFFEKIHDLLREVLDWLGDLIQRLLSRFSFSGIGGSGGGAKTVAAVILIILGAGLVTALSVLLIKILKKSSVKKKDRLTNEDLDRYADAPDEALALALRYRDEGNLRFACRYLFINLLTELNAREVIRISRSKTNRMYLREALSKGTVEEDRLAPFFRMFERVWYGSKPISAEELDRLFRELDLLLDAFEERLGSGGKEAGNG